MKAIINFFSFKKKKKAAAEAEKSSKRTMNTKKQQQKKRCTQTASTEASTENSVKSESVKRPTKKQQQSPQQKPKQQPQPQQPSPQKQPSPRRISPQQQRRTIVANNNNNNASNSSSKTSDSSGTAKDTRIKRRLKMVTTRKKTSKGKPPSKTASLDRSESSSAKSSKQKKKKPAAAKTDATQDVSAKTIKKKADSVDETQMEGAGGGGGPKHYRQEPRQKRDQSVEHVGDGYDKQLAIFVKETLKIGIPKLVKDFHEARATAPKNMPKTAFEKNHDKKRYKDVICMDETRVVLTWPPDNPNDYIHANMVKIRGEEKYICTQGPTPKTVEDFWRLIFQEKCKGIVMLTEVMELGKKKCEQYWPKLVGDSMTSGLCTIVNKKVTEVEKMLISTQLEITANGETLKCEHVLWTGWPDRGVPDNYLATLRLIRKMSPFSPCLVHCSAGIGRTGTIVGLDLCQKTLQAGEKVDMHEIVKELRKFRHGSVQTDVQFVFMHAVILKLAENRKAATKEQLKPFFDEYAAYVASRP